MMKIINLHGYTKTTWPAGKHADEEDQISQDGEAPSDKGKDARGPQSSKIKVGPKGVLDNTTEVWYYIFKEVLMLIGSAAYFLVSPSQIHGRIVTANGEGTESLSSKEYALLALDKGVELGLITDIEVPELRRQILESPLPRYKEDVDDLANLVVKIENAWARCRGFLKEEIKVKEKPKHLF